MIVKDDMILLLKKKNDIIEEFSDEKHEQFEMIQKGSFSTLSHYVTQFSQKHCFSEIFMRLPNIGRFSKKSLFSRQPHEANKICLNSILI